MKVLGIIPARGGSKRVPRKNVRVLGGKPLVAWTIEAAMAATCLDRVVVSSDDDEILNIASSYNPALALPRPVELATDTSPALDYVQHALDAIEEPSNPPFDLIVIIQPSSPFTWPKDIDETIRLLEHTRADSAVSVVKLDHVIHPLKLKILQGDRLLPYLDEEKGRMAAHELPDIYVRNCAVYASRRGVIEGGKIIGDDCRGYVMPAERSVDINTSLDLAFAEFLMARSPQATTHR